MVSLASLFDHLTLGETARVVRVMRRLRQQDVADVASGPQSQVFSLELGQYVPLSIRRKILRALDLEVEL